MQPPMHLLSIVICMDVTSSAFTLNMSYVWMQPPVHLLSKGICIYVTFNASTLNMSVCGCNLRCIYSQYVYVWMQPNLGQSLCVCVRVYANILNSLFKFQSIFGTFTLTIAFHISYIIYPELSTKHRTKGNPRKEML